MMQTITITIGRNSVLADMKVKSHAEVAAIANDKERYLAELGTEKEPEAHQCITDTFADVSSLMRRIVRGTIVTSANDDYAGSGDLILNVEVTPRKAAGLADSLTDALHAYTVDAALARYYKAVSRLDFAQAHLNTLPADLATIDRLIYRRTKPSYPTAPTTNEDTDDNDSQD